MSDISKFKVALDREFAGSVQSFLASDKKGLFLMELSMNGYDIHRNMDVVERIYKDEVITKSSYFSLDAGILRALQDLSETSEYLDFVVDYCHRCKILKSWGWQGTPLRGAARCALRKSDGSLRAPEELGLQSGGDKLTRLLLKQAIQHKDFECIKHLRTFSLASKLITDEFLNDAIRLAYNKDEKSLELFGEMLIGTEIDDIPLHKYWETLKLKEVFGYGSKRSSVAKFYSKEVVKKYPDGFVSMILNLSRSDAYNGNLFIAMMCSDGLDCYPGFILGYEGVLSAFDKQQQPRDYQGMIDICLKRKPLPGYIGLLCGIPPEEIQAHKRCAEVLGLIHELTGSREAIQLMDRKQRGRALMTDLAM